MRGFVQSVAECRGPELQGLHAGESREHVIEILGPHFLFKNVGGRM